METRIENLMEHIRDTAKDFPCYVDAYNKLEAMSKQNPALFAETMEKLAEEIDEDSGLPIGVYLK